MHGAHTNAVNRTHRSTYEATVNKSSALHGMEAYLETPAKEGKYEKVPDVVIHRYRIKALRSRKER